MNRTGVLQITDTLNAGGMERVALNLANLIPRDRYEPFLCTTRAGGPLARQLASDVGRLNLDRRHRLQVAAVQRMVAFVRANRVRILHAHSSSLFIASVVSLFPPHPAVVWHDHYGRYALGERPVWWLYRLVASRIRAVIAVNEALAEWARVRMGVPTARIWYVPNFVCADTGQEERPRLPGQAGQRIVCVANLRPQKDHVTLVRAMVTVAQRVPTAHLILVGASPDPVQRARVEQQIRTHRLASHVTMLGESESVGAILKACDIGVLSSASEGLPMALLEYGLAGLPTVATQIGQCAEVLDHGRAGIVVPVKSPAHLADALVSLLECTATRERLGRALSERIRERHSPGAVVGRVCRIYETVLQQAA